MSSSTISGSSIPHIAACISSIALYIIVYVLISTFSFSASDSAPDTGLTLNPIIIALDAAARSTSVSVIAPTPPCIALTWTSSLDNLSSDCLTAWTEPWTSAFITIFNSFNPSFIWLNKSSRDNLWLDFNISSLCCCCLFSAILLATLSLGTSTNWSPPCGTSESPSISTAVDGPATLTLLPFEFIIALTLPLATPATIGSPTLRVPPWTSTVATGPLPLSSCASITVPTALLSGFAFNSSISATNRTISSKWSIPMFFLAETGTAITSPPQSSTRSPCSDNSCLTLSGFAPSLSILFIATISGTSAALAWFIASTVWGIIPSSAATTSIAISVTWAPLALIDVKASCPGVSKNTIFCPFILTSEAPMCCVIPPASPFVTLVFLIASSKEVLPWSTCPITVTTGGLGFKSSSLSSSISINFSISSSVSLSSAVVNSNPNLVATNDAISKLISWFIVAIVPIIISSFITSDTVLPISLAKSCTVIFPLRDITFPLSAITSSFIIS